MAGLPAKKGQTLRIVVSGADYSIIMILIHRISAENYNKFLLWSEYNVVLWIQIRLSFVQFVSLLLQTLEVLGADKQ